MMGRGGRDRFQREFSPRFEDKGRQSGWGVAPPSRHLWVGNLSPRVTQNTLSEQFLRFGDLENIFYVPGRSYAFVNFKKEEDGIIALRGLQGVVIEGMPLRIEFAKGDRPPIFSQEEDYPQYNDDRHLIERGDSHFDRDLRPSRLSPERSYDKSKGSDSAEPSEVLWIGFPSYLKVDEMALRRAFSPFGEIDNITTFLGRSYAFVRFKSVVAACRAKDALQGKLFDNPRVNICFAKSDSPPAEHGRNSTGDPLALPLKSNFLLGGRAVGTFHRDRSFESPVGELHMASPRFASNWERMPGDASDMSYSRDIPLRAGPGPGPGPNVGGTFEMGSQRRMSEDAYEHYRDSPVAEGGAPWHDLPFERHRRSPLVNDYWGMDDGSLPLSKKLKTDSFPDRELPEYPFSDIKQEKQDIRPKLFPSLHEPHSFNRGVSSVTLDHKGLPDPSRNVSCLYAESDDSWKTDHLNAGPLLSNISSLNLQRFNSESRQPPLNEEWKWEGTIAKGGTPVCRARCFPVGKVLDFMLPEFLDCTARTGLDMLAKHYYQAASTWVVFFVPESDSDIAFYNEFMHYLGEKQRAAVAKLGEKTTLFLVPPSEFSEQVLKVPGKVSISGVILKFQQPSSSFGTLHHPLETVESKVPSLMYRPTDEVNFHEDTSFAKPTSSFISSSQSQNYFSSSSGPLAPITSTFSPPTKPGDNLLSSRPINSMEKGTDFHGGGRHDQFQHQNPLRSSWSSHLHNPNSSLGRFPPPASNAPLRTFDSSVAKEYPSANSRVVEGTTSSNYTPETPNIVPLPASKFPPLQQSKPQPSSSVPIPLQPEQLAQLAAILGQQKQSGKEPALHTDGANKQSRLAQNPSLQDHASMPSGSVVTQPSHSSLPSSLVGPQLAQASVSSGLVGSQPSQTQQLQQHPSMPTVQHLGSAVQQSNQQPLSSISGEAEADPQKRLQATLQLAAALLQQIQQQSKAADQK